MAHWNRHDFEIPDVIGFADYVASSKEVADCLTCHDAKVNGPGSLLSFPYPKSNNRLRWLHVAGPEDLTLLRTAAGQVVRTTDELLSCRVYSSRLDRRYRCWHFRNPKKAYARFRKRGLSLLNRRGHSAMCRTDVAGYYPSVNIERLRSLLHKCGCLGPASNLVLGIFRNWQLRDGLQGLPIGPEVSAVFGNFFLAVADGSLEASGHQHLRWSDDILTFGKTTAHCHDSMAVIDEVFCDLQLTRSTDKTWFFDNVLDARSNLEDNFLASLTDLLSFDDRNGTDAVHLAYDSRILGHPDVEQKHFRWVLRTLLNRNDAYACLSLARDPSVMNVDPKLAGQYLGEVALSGKRVREKAVVDAMMRRLSGRVDDHSDALDLHLLKAMSRRGFGDVEAEEFRKIATDVARRWPIRVYAWAAYIKSTHRYPELMEAARAETIPQLRRGMITSLKGQSPRSFLNHARENFPESRYVSDWLHAA